MPGKTFGISPKYPISGITPASPYEIQKQRDAAQKQADLEEQKRREAYDLAKEKKRKEEDEKNRKRKEAQDKVNKEYMDKATQQINAEAQAKGYKVVQSQDLTTETITTPQKGPVTTDADVDESMSAYFQPAAPIIQEVQNNNWIFALGAGILFGFAVYKFM
jgi:hypothetical protein